MRIRFLAALNIARFTSFVIDIVARGRGTNLPGIIALKIDPDFLKHIDGLDPDRTIFITGTNGKSTTTNLLAHVFRKAGRKVAFNGEGANMIGGVVVSLIKCRDKKGRLDADVVIMETDERFLPIIHKQIPARHLCVTNVQKDQVQRNGEPEIIRRKLASVINNSMTVYVNGDEPNALSLGESAGRCVTYGVDRNPSSFDKQDDFFSVTGPCPVCHEPVTFEAYNIDNIGPFRCFNCGFGSAENDYQATDIDFEYRTFNVADSEYEFRYSTPYFLYCYVAALAVAKEFGLDEVRINQAFRDFALQGGRMETIHVGSKEVKYLRMKQENPETVQSALNVIADDRSEKVFLLGLDELKDFDPHYTNTFYTFDCDFRRLIESGIYRCICFSETVAYDAALRLLYDGLDNEFITVLPSNDNEKIIEELTKCDCDNVYLLTWLHKFESLAEYVKSMEQD